MNDPGLHEPISDGAQAVEKKFDEGVSDTNLKDEQEEIKAYFLPTRWWYASTAFPLFAGTFGPMANTFSVCALVQYWRVEIPPGATESTGVDIKDPKWLLAVNALSLAFALGANVSLLLNMARRVSFSTAQPFTIFGFWIASILLLALVGVASSDFDAPGVENQALTQAYYYAIFAAGLYQFISYLLCITVWGAYKGHYDKEFKLTMSQRTLMLQTVSFMAYLLVGAAIYAHIEGWGYLDAVYWADFTCLTIGIGDFAPATNLGRGLLFPYAIGGIVSLGLVVGSIRSMVLDRGKKKLFARMTEKTRESILKRIRAEDLSSARPRVRGLGADTVAALRLDPTDAKASEHQRRQAEFEAMRAVQDLAARKRKWISLGISLSVFLVLWFAGALVFHEAERGQNWTYFDGLYFAYTSLLTIGYGDISPTSNSGKPFFVFWSLLAVPSLTILISDMGDTVVKIIKDLTIYLGEITVLPSDEGGLSDRLKYGVYILTGGKVGDDTNREDNDVKTKLPGMVNMLEYDDESSSRQDDVEAPRQGGPASNGPEEEARQLRSKIAKDEHHHRNLLISEVRKMYGHLHAKPPKKFSYGEWAYYLLLLGEDEHDRRYHRRAPVNPPQEEKTDFRPSLAGSTPSVHPRASQQQHTPVDESVTAPAPKETTGWSWLGNKSPLMGDKDEAAWILEKLFAVLEQSLKEGSEKAQRERHGGEHPPFPQRESERALVPPCQPHGYCPEALR